LSKSSFIFVTDLAPKSLTQGMLAVLVVEAVARVAIMWCIWAVRVVMVSGCGRGMWLLVD
jgi:hypothetical protein